MRGAPCLGGTLTAASLADEEARSLNFPTADAPSQPSQSATAFNSHVNVNIDKHFSPSPQRPPAALSSANGLRRTLSAPWHALAGRRAKTNGVDRSANVPAHARGGADSPAAAQDPSNRSHASHASRRSTASQFTADGLPEQPPPDVTVRSLPPDCSAKPCSDKPSGPGLGVRGISRLAQVVSSVLPGSRNEPAPAPLHVPSAAPTSLMATSSGDMSGRQWQPAAPQSCRAVVLTDPAAADVSNGDPPESADASWRLTPDAPGLEMPGSAQYGSGHAGGVTPPHNDASCSPAAAALSLPPPPASPRAAAAALPCNPGDAMEWDDVDNPMSPYYIPPFDQHLQPPPSDAVGLTAATTAPFPPLSSGGGGGAAVQPSKSPPHDSSHFNRRRRPSGARTAEPPAPVGAGAGTNSGGGDSKYFSNRYGGDGGGAVYDDARVVLLEMKGPPGTPSPAAAAAAAYASGASASPAAPEAAAAALAIHLTLRGRIASYFGKWRGVGDTLMPLDQPVDVFWSWLGAFLSILAVAVLQQFLTPHISLPLMIASFGASAVLLFGVPASKLAQPRNFLGGQLVSAVVGVAVRLAFLRAPQLLWLSAALGMSLALAAMQLTRTVHPPGGASALIAASALNIGPWHGFKFVLTVLFGCLAMMAVAVVVNNLSARRRYPTYWMGA